MNTPVNFFFATLVLLVCTRAIYLIIASATRPTWVAVVRTPPPTDGTEVLLRTKWGIVSGWYAARAGYGEDASGPKWICYDDKFEIEIEESAGEMWSEVTHWMPIPKGIG